MSTIIHVDARLPRDRMRAIEEWIRRYPIPLVGDQADTYGSHLSYVNGAFCATFWENDAAEECRWVFNLETGRVDYRGTAHVLWSGRVRVDHNNLLLCLDQETETIPLDGEMVIQSLQMVGSTV